VAGRENHRERLLHGALKCLREKGYAHTTARDIAAAANANLGSIGYHFGSKEALLGEALNEGFRQWTQYVGSRALARDGATPLEHLHGFWSAAAEGLEEEPGLMLAFIEALPAAAHSPALRAQLADLIEEARQAMQVMIESAIPETKEDDPRAVRTFVSLLIAIVDGLALQWIVDPERAPTEQDLADTVEALLAAPAGWWAGR
jgi:AcrR family transcriptional regulator